MEQLIERIADIVIDVERSSSFKFDLLDVGRILHHTIRKARSNGKGDDYIPVLFENELQDFITRLKINEKGRKNLCMDTRTGRSLHPGPYVPNAVS